MILGDFTCDGCGGKTSRHKFWPLMAFIAVWRSGVRLSVVSQMQSLLLHNSQNHETTAILVPVWKNKPVFTNPVLANNRVKISESVVKKVSRFSRMLHHSLLRAHKITASTVDVMSLLKPYNYSRQVHHCPRTSRWISNTPWISERESAYEKLLWINSSALNPLLILFITELEKLLLDWKTELRHHCG